MKTVGSPLSLGRHRLGGKMAKNYETSNVLYEAEENGRIGHNTEEGNVIKRSDNLRN